MLRLQRGRSMDWNIGSGSSPERRIRSIVRVDTPSSRASSRAPRTSGSWSIAVYVALAGTALLFRSSDGRLHIFGREEALT